MARKFKLGGGKWATTDNVLLSYNDTNGNYKPLPMAFARTSKATRVNENGLIEEVAISQPRINFANNSKGEVLLEHFRTNRVLYSEDFNQWGKINVTVTSNSVISLDGTQNADKLIATSGSSNKVINQVVPANTYTASVFAKKGEFEGLFIGTGTTGAFFNLNTYSYRTHYQSPPTSYKIEKYNNGWYRYSVTFTISSSNSIYIGPNDNVSTTLAITGDGSKGIYIYGAQAEQGKFATSIIPTNGTIVSRTSDSFQINNAPILQATNQFTIYWEAKNFLYTDSSNTGFDSTFLIFGAGSSAYDTGTGVHVYNRTWYWFNGTDSINLGLAYNAITDSKFALSYDGTKFTRYANGVKLGTYTASASMVNWDTLNSAATNDGQNDQRIWNLADLELYDTALTDAELISKTTI